jgi:outer membrane protein assembly factor BamB
MSHASPEPSAAPASSPPRKWRTWIPAAIIVSAVIILAALVSADTAELVPPANSFLFKLSTVGLATILLFLWVVFLSPISRGARVRVGLTGVAVVAALALNLQVAGVSGDIVPKLKFRWAPRADEALPKLSYQPPTTTDVDLTRTTSDDSPQFLGANRLGTFERVAFGRDWTAHPPKELWRQPIGAGWSSFAVVGHFGVTQEQRGEDELITCYDINNGKLEWAQATPVRFSAVIAGIGPRATPTIHEGKVYAMGAVGNVYCLDGATGKVMWQHDIVTETDAEVPQWGKSCSPVVYENLVIVSAGGSDGKSLLAYDKETGKLIWSAGDDAASYSSPALLTLCGHQQIVMVNQRIVTAHDPKDGHILWEHPWPDTEAASPNVSQPLAAGEDRVLLTKGYGVGSALWKISHEADDWSVEQLWKNRNLKTKFTNAVIRGDYAYGLDEDILSCIDITSGKRKWIKGRYNHGQVLLVGDLLLVQSETGDVALVEASPDAYRELTRFTAVTGQSWNYPVLIGRKLLVRTEEEAVCWELPPAEE